MPFYIGENKIVDRYIGDKLVIAVYKGETKYFDAYSEITGSLPIIFKSRAAVALKNYLLHGTSEGAGVQTENIVDDYLEQAYISTTSGGVVASYSSIDLALFQIVQGETYTIKRFESAMELYTGFFISKPIIGSVTYDETIHVPSPIGGNIFMFEAPITGWAAVRSSRTVAKQKSIVAVQGSTAPSTYIPYGYEIPLTDTSGVTENLFDKDSAVDGYWLQSSNGAMVVQSSYCVSDYIPIVAGETYISYDAGRTFCWYDQTKTFIETSPKGTDATAPQTASFLRVNLSIANKSIAMLTNLSTPPDRYIPHRYTSDYPLYIGSTKLGEEEYLDYETGKIYKMIDGVLTPTDPPVPFPAISTYKGENTLSSTETLGEATIKGRINELPTQQSDN